MSYTLKIRQEIAETIPKNARDRRALLLGLMLSADVSDGNIRASFSSSLAYETCEKLVRFLFGGRISAEEIRLAGRTSYNVTVTSKKLAELILSGRSGISELLVEADELSFLLRGLFLACGRINDPMAQAHMELSFSDAALGAEIRDLIERHGIARPGCSSRRDKTVVYYKSNEKMCDMLQAMSMGSILFEYINTSIYKDIENSERRATNCISGNINRAVVAGSRHIAACRFVLSLNQEDELDSSLRTTARLRIDNPTMSMSELAEKHVPPISKSGINHRLQKITEIAERHGFSNDKD